jgi:hypothetical protein
MPSKLSRFKSLDVNQTSTILQHMKSVVNSIQTNNHSFFLLCTDKGISKSHTSIKMQHKLINFNSMIKELNQSLSFFELVQTIQKEHSAAKRNDKARWLSLVKGFTPLQLKKWGFKFSKDQLKRSRRIEFSEISKVGRPRTLQTVKDSIVSWIKTQTTPAANKTVKLTVNGHKITKPVQHIHCCIKSLYLFDFISINYKIYGKFLVAHPEISVCESVFRQTIPKYIKKATKATDLCPYCEDIKKVSKRKREIEEAIQMSPDDEQLQNTHVKLQEYEFNLKNHQDRNTKQRQAFEEKIKLLQKDEAILLMDFKENIKLGGN